MIRVTIEMVPGGAESHRHTYHIIEIMNDVVGSFQSGGRKGDYNYRISRKIRKGRVAWHKEGTVRDFPRTQKNAVRLLLAVLKDAYE